MAPNDDSAETLREEILEQAREESEEIIRRAREEAEKILADAAAEAQSVRDRIIEKGRAEAARRRELIEATVPVEAGRIRVARIEALLESVREEARRRLLARQGFEYREVLMTLASEAIARMAGDRFVVRIAEADRAFLGDALGEEIARRVGRPGLSVDLAVDRDMGGGVYVEDADTSQVWDNGLLQRLERMWPELRQQVAIRASLVPAGQPGEGGQ